jgi:hypothetical protein
MSRHLTCYWPIHLRAERPTSIRHSSDRSRVRKVLRSGATEFRYERSEQPLPRIGPWQDALDGMLTSNEAKPARTVDADPGVRGATRSRLRRRLRRCAALCAARPGGDIGGRLHSAQFPWRGLSVDWSHEVVLINGTTVTVKVAHVHYQQLAVALPDMTASSGLPLREPPA